MLHWKQAEQIETHTTTDRLNKILFVNDSVGYIAGGERFYYSTILMTRDGGKTWSYNSLPDAGKELFGLTLTPQGNIYTIGFDGKLLFTENGKSWTFIQLRYDPFKDLYFINDNHGIAIGGISYHSGFIEHFNKDGTIRRWDSTSYELNDLEMIDASTGYLCGFGIMLKTTDSAASWQQQNIGNDNFTAVHAYGLSEAWTCGYNGSIFHTVNGGNSWEKLRNGNDLTIPHYRLTDILFTGPLTGYAVGENGLVIYTDDGGNHWMEFDRFTSSTLRCIVKAGDGSLMVCGDNGSLYKLVRRN